MKAAEPNPPPLPPVAAVCDRRAGEAPRSPSAATTAPPRGRRALLSLFMLLGLMVLARVALHCQLPLPACPLRETTGVPCPLCGGTRAFASLAGLDFAEALRLNPLVSLAACGAGGWWLLVLLRREGWLARLKTVCVARAGWKWLLALAVLADWVYLWFSLPR